MLNIFAVCHVGYDMGDLADNNRIIIVPVKDDKEMCYQNSKKKGSEFLSGDQFKKPGWRGATEWGRQEDGFIAKLGSLGSPSNIASAFHQGTKACNIESHESVKIKWWLLIPYLETWSSIDDTSTPILEDNNDNDYVDSSGNKYYGRQWNQLESDYKTNSERDGWLSYHTYL